MAVTAASDDGTVKESTVADHSRSWRSIAGTPQNPRLLKKARLALQEFGGPILRRDFIGFARLVRRSLTPMDGEYRRKYRMSLRNWLLYHQREIVLDKCRWMGVPALKNPLDAWIYQEILYETRPEVVVEIGSAAGGGTLYLAHLMDIVSHGLVVSVDMDRSNYVVEHDRIVEVTGRSDDPRVVESVAAQCAGKRVMVIHDADHSKDQVLKDLSLYAPFVSVGCYLVIEDGIVDLFRAHDGLGWRREGPLAATRQFLRENEDFKSDLHRERYLMTYNPRGFLIRNR